MFVAKEPSETDHGSLILQVTWPLAVLAATVVTARWYTSAKFMKMLDWALAWSTFACLHMLVSQALLTVAVFYGLGSHGYDLSAYDRVQALKFFWFAQPAVLFGILSGRLAIAALLFKILGATHKGQRHCLWFLVVSNIFLNVVECTLLFCQCRPMHKLWYVDGPGKCFHNNIASIIGYLQGSWGAMSDIYLTANAWFVIWDLHMSASKKISLYIAMGGGLVASGAAIAKTMSIPLTPIQTDPTFLVTALAIWGPVEQALVIALGAIAPLRPLAAWLLRKFHVSIGSTEFGSRIQSLLERNPTPSKTATRLPSTANSDRLRQAHRMSHLFTESVENMVSLNGQIVVTTQVEVAETRYDEHGEIRLMDR